MRTLTALLRDGQRGNFDLLAGAGELDGRYVLTVLIVFGLVFALTTFLLLTLTDLLREGERRIRDTNLELQRLSDMRRDFLHIALHNLQSPVGASTMVLKNLRSGLVGTLTDEQNDWVDRALKRLGGLTAFITDLQTLASLESGRLELQAELPHVNPSTHRDYREYYDDRSRARVAETFRNDIALFGYDFDGIAGPVGERIERAGGG